MLIKKEKPCSKCVFARWSGTDNGSKSIMECGYVCRLNPFKPIGMGINGTHEFRKKDK